MLEGLFAVGFGLIFWYVLEIRRARREVKERAREIVEALGRPEQHEPEQHK